MAVSIDRYDNIFYADESGSIFCYDTNGIKLNEYSPQRVARVWNIEAWKSVKIFTFYRELQEYSLFNRFLVPTAEQFKIANNDNLIGFARSATLSFDESIWLFDEQDFSLKKYNSEQQLVIVNTPLSLILESNEYNINYMREYENILFVNDANSGILVFDNLGNYKKKIPYSGLNYFGFVNEEMYFLKNNKLFFFHLYNFLERIIDLPDVKGKILFVIYNSKHLTIFTSKELYIFQVQK